MADEPSAAEREAEGAASPLTIEWEGFTLVVPAAVEDWSADALEAFEKGQAVTALRGVLGSKAYDVLREGFQEKHGRKLAVRELGSLGDLIAATYGIQKKSDE